MELVQPTCALMQKQSEENLALCGSKAGESLAQKES